MPWEEVQLRQARSGRPSLHISICARFLTISLGTLDHTTVATEQGSEPLNLKPVAISTSINSPYLATVDRPWDVDDDAERVIDISRRHIQGVEKEEV